MQDDKAGSAKPLTELEYVKSLLKRIRENCVEPWKEASFVDVRYEIDHYFIGMPDEVFVSEPSELHPFVLHIDSRVIDCDTSHKVASDELKRARIHGPDVRTIDAIEETLARVKAAERDFIQVHKNCIEARAEVERLSSAPSAERDHEALEVLRELFNVVERNLPMPAGYREDSPMGRAEKLLRSARSARRTSSEEPK